MGMLGVCYYPEHWSEDHWPRDAQRMYDLGLRYVRIGEFAWGRIEKAEGLFDWAWMDRAIEVLRGTEPLRNPDLLALQATGTPFVVWVLADNGLDVHDGFSGRLLGHWPAPDGARLDRLEVDASGRLSVWSGTQCFEPVAGGALGGCGATCARPCAAAAGASERSISSSTGDGSFRRPA